MPIWGIIIAIALFLTFVFGGWYWLIDETSVKMLGLVGGMVSGLAVFLITYITVIGPSIKLERYSRMGIVDVLDNRHDKEYYKKLVSKARQSVRVMGASCSRFVEDFIDPSADDKVLFNQLQQHARLKVELLVALDKHLDTPTKAKTKRLAAKLAEIEAILPGRVKLRRFDSKPHHSFVIVDDDLVAGPIFEGDQSRHAPAVHVKMSTTFAQKYRDFFEKEWARSV